MFGVVALLGGFAPVSRAATVAFSGQPGQSIPLDSGTLATWDVRNDIGTGNGLPTGTCGSNPQLGVYDSTLDPNGINKGDAVDGAFLLWVNDVQFVAPDSVDVTDETLTAGPVAMSGLDVTMEYRALPSTPTLRALATFHNPTSQPIQAHVVLATNYGSDGLTGARSDTLRIDHWRVTSDNAVTPTDPVLLLVSFGPPVAGDSDAFVPLSGTDPMTFICGNGSDAGREINDTLFVAPGATLYMMQFLRLTETNEEALAVGPTFDVNPDLSSELMTGITQTQSLAIANWNYFGGLDLAAGEARWTIGGWCGADNLQPTGGTCGTVQGLGVIDAHLTDPRKSDAFDGGLVLFVDDARLPITAGQLFLENAVLIGPVTLSGLEVSITYAALGSSPTLRTLVEVHNPTGAPISTTIALATNVGSDDNTLIRGTSSGDDNVTDVDRWVITSDKETPSPNDPVNTHVVAGPGTPAVTPTLATRVFDCSDSKDPNGVLARYALTVGPGEIQSVLLFNQLHREVSEATTDVASFDATPSPVDPLLAAFDPPSPAEVVNWTLCRGTTHPDAICRVDGLFRDLFANTAEAILHDKIASRLSFAKESLINSGTAAGAGKRGAAKKGLKNASAALKSFEKLLKSKKVKQVLADAIRARMTTNSASIRKTVKGLPTAI